MDKKMKRNLIRIIVVFVLFVALFILEKMGVLDPLPGMITFAIFFIPYLIIGYDVIIQAAKNISHGQVFDENFLMMIATFAAFALGLFGDGEYPEALAVMLFYQTGELFQDYAVGKSRASIAEMMEIAPEYANLISGDTTEEVDPEDVQVGDLILVKPGEKIPLDGIVVEGESFLDTAALTGESAPRKVEVGEPVISGCINGSGTLKVRVEKAYEDSTVARILELVEESSAKKGKIENFITRFARYYTPIVTIGAVVLAIVLPLLLKEPWTEGIRRACNFLIVSCPCALVISVPLGFFGGIGAASRIGVLVKGSSYIELASKLGTVVMDKTGTVTKGEFKVKEINAENGFSDEDVLKMAACAEGFSTHPIAKSIVEAYGSSPDGSSISDLNEIAGHGIKAELGGKNLLVGNGKLLTAEGIEFNALDAHGTIIYVAYDGKLAGSLVIDDTIKAGAKEAIEGLKNAGVAKTVMLTGDHKNAAERIAAEVGIDQVESELLPEDKVDHVEALIKETANGGNRDKLAFVGDGINDAPVLMRADVGIAMGSLGSDAAIEAADIVIMDDDLRKIPKVIKIAIKTMRIVRSNIIFALAVKAIVLILSIFGLASMWLAVFADVGVAVLCIINSMRALRVKNY